MKKKRKILPAIVSGLFTLVIAFLLFWFQLPPLNLRSPEFWVFAAEVLASALIIFSISSIIPKLKDLNNGNVTLFENIGDFKGHGIKAFFKRKKGWRFYIISAIVLIVVFLTVGGVFSTEIFNASSYRDLITVNDGNFASDIDELSLDMVPVVDRDTASRLGKRQLGNIPDLVSQFEISEDYTQVNVNGRAMRVTPLTYADFFKWWGNQAEGIPAYITVDMVTQETELVRLPEGSAIRYSESEYFMRNIYRYLRFAYPTEIFGEILFEIDDAGTPYWVAPCMEYRIGIWGGMDVKGAVLDNAVTGDANYYDKADIPQWIDRVYDAENIITQLNWNGTYQEGFLNAYFGQRNVRIVTDGYSYIAQHDDVYLYTGMTSATSDESNIGFVLVNMRTKDTTFYTVPGAEEYSAMSSAEGQVQHLKYTATFPLLLNISDRPTYFMSLKDASGLVKMYAYVDVQSYHIVGTGDTVESAKADYLSKLNIEEDLPPVEVETESFNGVISEIASAVVDNTTVYYIRLEGDTRIFTAAVTLSPELPFTAVGDTVSIEALSPSDDQLLISAVSVTVNEQ